MTTSWPPETLTINAEEIINECELMEMYSEGAVGKEFVPVVQLAALLYTGEYVHARHVWRRWKANNPPPQLGDWWKVGKAMMDCDALTLWQGLAHIAAHHPAPLSKYAEEVGTVYRKRILQEFPPTQPYLGLLNFHSPQELEQFSQAHQVSVGRKKGKDGESKTDLTQVVAFLESTPWSVAS